MKRFKLCMLLAAMFALTLTSCSKEDEIPTSKNSTLSFATVLNDLMNENKAMKQAVTGIPECSDATPAFVEVVLAGPENVGTMAEPLVVSVNPNPGNYDGDPEAEYFTDEAAELELEPGVYSLQFFAVYDGDPADEGSNRIWIAPNREGSLADFVDNPLPMDIVLGAGVKKYVDVDVLCFDDRVVNEYGYLFFDIEENEAIEFCIYGNFCPPSGRHFPAAYSVDVWSYEDGVQGAMIHSDLTATVATDANGDWAASPVCMALPDTEGLDEYYFEITLMDSDAYDTTERVIRQGVINDDEVRTFFDGDNNLDYFHFREGCDGNDGPPIFDDPQDEALQYKACLTEVGDSDAVAFAYMSLEGDVLETHVYGFNLEPNQVHPQHIHGLDATENSTCDNPGPPIIPLYNEMGEYPTADSNGMTTSHRTYILGSDGVISRSELGDLENRTVNVHGRMIDGEYVAGDVVACAEIVQVN